MKKLELSDWIYRILIFLLSTIGLLFIASATYTADTPLSVFFKKQVFGVISGMFIFWIVSRLDYRSFQQWGSTLFFVTLGLLIFTLFKGSIGLGAQRWISLGLIKFQPSELAKLFFPAFFTYHIMRYRDQALPKSSFIPIILILGISCFTILKQPDLGTALIILFSALLLLWIIGIGKKFFVCLSLIILIGAPIGWHYLKPYQKKRVIVFLGGGTSDKERYQIEQSRIAIGSGGLWGKGYLKGTQNRFNFLPESRTDFIFSVICEETGFVGSLFVILLYTLLFSTIIIRIIKMHHVYAQLLAIGLLLPSILSMIINCSMVLGLLPIVGIPLPLITYGITNLWITLASFGALSAIIRQQKQ